MTERGPARYPRLTAVGLAIGLSAAVLTGRILWLGAVAADDSRPLPHRELPPQRGAIWDRRGGLLAAETYLYDVGVATNEIEDPVRLAAAVAPLVGRSALELGAEIGGAERRWVPVARRVPASAAASLAELGLGGLYLIPVADRSYPLGPIAAHVTGFVNAAGDACCGVEASQHERLRGRPGRLSGNFGSEPRTYRPPQDGTNVILTIDRSIQLAAGEALAQILEEQSAEGGSVVVIEPRTGAILASTSLPSYDPNRFADADPAAYLDPVVSAQYEPGSVVKAFTMAAALDAGVVTRSSTYVDTGSFEYAGITIANWDRLAHGETSMTELLMHSLNVGAIHLSLALGAERFYSYMEAFGFGSPTGVDLAGEISGVLHVPDREPDWYAGNLATNSFGQGMAATPLQVAAAFGALANHGLLMRPYVVAAFQEPDGRIERSQPHPVRQVVGAAAADTVRQMLEQVVLGGVASAAIPGYSVGGKTGTSQIPVPGGYDPHGTVASFAGFLPVSDPRVVILVTVVRPDDPRGRDVAAPVFRQVAESAIRALDIPPDQDPLASGALR